MRPNDEMLKFYLRKAEQSLDWARAYRDYHLALAYYNLYRKLQGSDPEKAGAYLEKARKLLPQAKSSIDRYFAGPLTYGRWRRMGEKTFRECLQKGYKAVGLLND